MNQVAAGLKMIDFAPGTTNLDIGGGKYDAGTKYLAEKGVENLVFDPFNRDAEENQNARALDHSRTDSYWSVDTELFARAFSSFIEDKLKEQGRKSEYLSYGSENELYDGWKPFPEGEERTKINAAFQDFFNTLKTEETKDGNVRLYSVKKRKEYS